MNYHHPGARHTPQRTARLVVAPQAGDETLGCGGMLAKRCDDSGIVVLAELDDYRMAQFKTAQRMLGEPHSTLLGMSPRDLRDDTDRLVGVLAGLITLLQPAEVYLPFPSTQDRLVAYEAGMRATRQAPTHGVTLPVSVLMYDVGAADVADYPADVQWNVCEPLRHSDVERKVAAAIAYRSPLAQGLRSSAAAVGAAKCETWAEQFAVVRAPRGLERHRPEDTYREAPAMAGSLP